MKTEQGLGGRGEGATMDMNENVGMKPNNCMNRMKCDGVRPSHDALLFSN